MNQPTDRPCRACQAELTFVLDTVTGKTHPLDKGSCVYVVYLDRHGQRRCFDVNDMLAAGYRLAIVDPEGERLVNAEGFYVTHFRTFPEANRFSGSDRKREPEPSLFGEAGPRVGLPDVGGVR